MDDQNGTYSRHEEFPVEVVYARQKQKQHFRMGSVTTRCWCCGMPALNASGYIARQEYWADFTGVHSGSRRLVRVMGKGREALHPNWSPQPQGRKGSSGSVLETHGGVGTTHCVPQHGKAKELHPPCLRNVSSEFL